MATRRRNTGEAEELLSELRKRLHSLPSHDRTRISIEVVLAALVAAASGPGGAAEVEPLFHEATKYLNALAEYAARPILEVRRRSATRDNLKAEFLAAAHSSLLRPRDEAQFLLGMTRHAIGIATALQRIAAVRVTKEDSECLDDATELVTDEDLERIAERIVEILEVSLKRCRQIRLAVGKRNAGDLLAATTSIARILRSTRKKHWARSGAPRIAVAYLRAIRFPRPDNLFR